MDEFAEINVTPFTDVLLVLLIIFMVLAAMIVPAGFEQQLLTGGAKAHVSTPTNHHDLMIARSGAMTLDGQTVSEKSIYNVMAALRAGRANVSLSISGDAKAPYRYVIRAIDAAKAAGITNVGFVTK